jgi:alpha-tubulin suppressor-like RCC1 family protein
MGPLSREAFVMTSRHEGGKAASHRETLVLAGGYFSRRVRVLRLLAALAVVTLWLGGGGVSAASAESSVMAWGENGDGQLGNGSFPGPESCPEGAGYCSRTPVPVSGLSGVTALAGGSQGLALLSNGTVMAWGRNADGQLGDGCCENSDVPVPVPGLSGVTAVAASYGISMALLSNGTVKDWGENGNGQLGDGTANEDTPTPVEVFRLSEVIAIATGGSYGLALLRNGTVMTWGSGGGANSYIPVQVKGLSEVTAIAADGGHSLALLKNGTVMAWGENEYGELGDGTTDYSSVPVRVSGLREVEAIADGADHNLAVLKSGTVMAWGQNDWGQLGDGFAGGYGSNSGPETCAPTSCSTIPVPVSGLSEATAIATGYGQSLALLANETVMGWGEDFSGQVGSGTAVPGIGLPVAVSGLSEVTSITGGDVFSMAELHGETGQVAGKVASASGGAPLEGVSVCAHALNGVSRGRCAQTKANGEYVVSGLAAGEYTVEFSPPSRSTLNYTAQYYEGKSSLSEAKPVPVAVADTTQGIDAKLEVGGQIGGEVTSVGGAKKLAGIEVCASKADGGGFGERCALTNASGGYTISGLASGKYSVEFSAPSKNTSNYITQFYKGVYSISEATLVTVTAEQLTSGVDAELEERKHLTGQGIAGQVTNASTKAGVKGIEVCAYEVGSETSEGLFGECVETNALGEYALSGLPSDEYIVEFVSPFGSGLNYVTQYYKESGTFANATPVSVSAGSADTEIDAQLEEGGRITGEVTDASTSAAIEGIEVCAFSTGSESLGCALTDTQGGYTISALGGGDYDVEFLSPPSLDYVTQYYDEEWKASAASPVPVAEGSTTPSIDAQLEQGGRIEGKVTGAATNAAMKDVLVCALQSVTESVGCALTAASGGYTISGLPGGKYEVGFDAGKGYVIQYYEDRFSFSEAQAVTVTPGSTTAPIDAAMGTSALVPPVNTKAPVIFGTPAVGERLSCATGLWTGIPTPTFTVQWLRDGVPIAGAIGSSYQVQGADEGSSLACRVTAKSTAGEMSATSIGLAIPASSTAPIATPSPAATSTTLTTTHPTSSPLPVVRIVGSGLVVSGDSVSVHLTCDDATCRGSTELTMRVLSKGHKGAKTVTRRETLVLAEGTFSLTRGKGAAVVLRLTAAGRRRLARAKRHPVAANLILSVKGGKTIVKSVMAS